MDDELQALEAELQRLRPAPPSPALRARLQRALAAPPASHPNRRTDWWWLTLPVAAAAMIVLNLKLQDSAPTSPEPALAGQAAVHDTLKPVAAENVLYAAADEGLVTLDDGTAARRERLHFVDTITWRNPRTNASLTWSVPREEVRIVPVRFQ